MYLLLIGLVIGLILGMALVGMYVILLFAFKDRRITRVLLSGFWRATAKPWLDVLSHIAGIHAQTHRRQRQQVRP